MVLFIWMVVGEGEKNRKNIPMGSKDVLYTNLTHVDVFE